MVTHSSNLPEEVHGQRSLVGYSPWGCKEVTTTKQLTLSLNKRKVIKYIMMPAENTTIEKDETYTNMAKS